MKGDSAAAQILPSRVRHVARKAVTTYLTSRGLELTPRRPGFHHVPNIYGEKHEKLIDPRELDGFGPIAKGIIEANRSYLGYARLHTLWQAVQQAPAGDIAELGVYNGGSAMLLAEAAIRFRPDATLHLFDTFSHFPDTRPSVDITDRSGVLPISASDVAAYLSPRNVTIHEGVFPQTADAVQHARFGVVHVDSDTYSSYAAAFEFFAPRVPAGGWIVLDDYGFITCPGAKVATDEFLASASDWRFLHLVTGQGVLIRWRK